MKKLAVVALAAVASSAWAVPGSLTVGSSQYKGDIVWKASSSSYAVTDPKTKATKEYPLDQVAGLNIPAPNKFDNYVASGDVKELERIVKEYRMLDWDKKAARALVRAYLKSGKAEKAYETAQNIMKDDKTAAFKGDLAPAYWEALDALGRDKQLENCLRKAVSDGDRTSSAAALVMRGNLLAKSDARKALVDAYLRVALLYTERECLQPRLEALDKCVECFNKLNMNKRADDMRSLKQQLTM